MSCPSGSNKNKTEILIFKDKSFFEKNATLHGEISFFDFGEGLIEKCVSVDCQFCGKETKFSKLDTVKEDEAWFATYVCLSCTKLLKFYVDIDAFMDKLVKTMSRQGLDSNPNE